MPRQKMEQSSYGIRERTVQIKYQITLYHKLKERIEMTEEVKQIRLWLTLSAEEDMAINEAYGRYVLAGGKMSRNKWIMERIMESIS